MKTNLEKIIREVNNELKISKKERKKEMNDFVTGLIRTYVPIIVGAVVAWLLTLGIDLDAETQAGLVIALTGVLQAAYYTLIRLVAKKFPWVESLLGSSKKPEYKEV